MDDPPEQQTMYLLTADPKPQASDPQTPEAPTKNPAKVTARMLQIRELIQQGEYPDKDELAERIVDDK